MCDVAVCTIISVSYLAQLSGFIFSSLWMLLCLQYIFGCFYCILSDIMMFEIFFQERQNVFSCFVTRYLGRLSVVAGMPDIAGVTASPHTGDLPTQLSQLVRAEVEARGAGGGV